MKIRNHYVLRFIRASITLSVLLLSVDFLLSRPILGQSSPPPTNPPISTLEHGNLEQQQEERIQKLIDEKIEKSQTEIENRFDTTITLLNVLIGVIALIPGLLIVTFWILRNAIAKALIDRTSGEAIAQITHAAEGKVNGILPDLIDKQETTKLIRDKGLTTSSHPKGITPEIQEKLQEKAVTAEGKQELQELVNQLGNLEKKPQLTFTEEDYILQGNALFSVGKYSDAVSAYKNAIEINPESAEAHYCYGNALFNVSKYKEAFESYDKAIKLKPDLYYAWYDRGNALGALGDYEGAIASYKKALEIKPDYSRAWYGQGLAMFNLGRYEDAVFCYSKAADLKPDRYWVWYDMGKVLCCLERYPEALDSYQKAIDNYSGSTVDKSGYPEAWYGKVISLVNLSRHDEKVINLEKFEQAVKIFRTTVNLEHESAEAWLSKGNAQLALDDPHGALESYSQSISRMPTSAEAFHGKGCALFLLNKDQEALESFTESTRIKPNYAEAWHKKGDTFSRLGMRIKAIESYEKATSLKPNYAEAWHERGRILEESGCYKDALKSYEEAIKSRPQNHCFWLSKGHVLRQQRKYDDAINSYKEALGKTQGDCPEARYGMARCYSLQGNEAQAVINLEQISLDEIEKYRAQAKVEPDFDAICKNEHFQQWLFCHQTTYAQ